ncbi:MAG: PorV/PorQ family protein [Bacteroidales bacterium]|jgi:hypothetical protein|nr:PorV/PorQ family protein [Bacteroidales bacterium]
MWSSNIRKWLLVVACYLFTTVPTQAQSGIGTQAVPFLEITTSARHAGMGGYGLFHSEATGIFTNAATGMFSNTPFGVGTTLSARKNLKDGNLYAVGSFYNWNKNNGLAFGVRYFAHPRVSFTEGLLQVAPVNFYRPTDAAIDLAYIRRLTDKLSVSGTVRYVYSDLGISQDFGKGMGFAADLGLVYENVLPETVLITWRTGLLASNFGTPMYYGSTTYTMPFSVKWANTFALPLSENHIFNVVLNGGYRILPVGFSAIEGNVGLEYNMFKYGFLRAGYHVGHEERGLGNFLSLGAGAAFAWFKVDVAYWLGTKDEAYKNILYLSLSAFF